MFDEAISLLSIWASLNTWFTPTFLFLFLNLMIGTIFITSSFNSPKPQQPPPPPPPPPSQITRAPSVLQRLKSVNFYSYYSQQNSSPASDPVSDPKPEQIPTTRAQSQIQTQAQAIEEDIVHDDEGPTLDEIYSRIKGISANHHHRQNSDTVPINGDIPVKLPAKMKKSASDKSAFNHFVTADAAENAAADSLERENIAVAAAAMTVAAGGGGGGMEVDAMADDFINRFKKQLQLQRNESIVRYKDMITRGSAQ